MEIWSITVRKRALVGFQMMALSLTPSCMSANPTGGRGLDSRAAAASDHDIYYTRPAMPALEKSTKIGTYWLLPAADRKSVV